MAEKKTTSGKTRKPANETRAEAADALRKAAELIDSLNAEAQAKTAAKKPAAKKTASKAPAKKPATKAAPKKAPAKKPEPVEEETLEQPPVEEVKPAAAEEQAQVAETTQVTETAVEQPAPQPQAEVAAAEEPPVVEQPAPQPVQTEQQEVLPAPQNTAKAGFAKRSGDFINNKGKLPLFIIANLLLVISSVLLIITAFSISYHSVLTNSTETRWYSLFGYFSNGDIIKLMFAGMAGNWANGGYVMIGILMILAFLLPLALVVKNIVFLIVKKDKNVNMLDAIISFAFLIAYLGIVNLYGANMTAGHLIAFIICAVLLAFTVFVKFVQSETRKFPIFSCANIAVIIVCTFLLTATPVYSGKVGIYAGKAAAMAGGSGFAFVLLIATVLAFILFMIMQLKRLPALLEFIVPAVFGVFALITVITMGVSMPDGLSIGGGFVFGCVLTMLLAIADVLFAAIGKLRTLKVTVADLDSHTVATYAAAQQPQAVQTATTVCASCGMENEAGSQFCLKCGRTLDDSLTTAAPAPAQELTSEPAQEVLKCPACGTENEPGTVFCLKCGRKMK